MKRVFFSIVLRLKIRIVEFDYWLKFHIKQAIRGLENCYDGKAFIMKT